MNDMKEKAMGAVKAFLERKGYEIVDEAWQGPEGIGGWADRLAEVDGGKPSLTASRWDSIRNAKVNLTRKELEEDFKSSLIQCKRVDGAGAIVDWRMQIADPGAYDEAGILALLAEVLDQPELTDREKRLLELARNGEQRLVEFALQVFAEGGTTHLPDVPAGGFSGVWRIAGRVDLENSEQEGRRVQGAPRCRQIAAPEQAGVPAFADIP